jgi:DNA topoisomerase-3
MLMTQLVIAEKPSAAQSLAAVIGARERHDGYLEGGGYVVSWCYGHLLGFADAAAYDEKYAKWRCEDLPIIPEVWKFAVGKNRAKQLKTLLTLMKRADVGVVVNACDAGREGELIFRLVYGHAACKKPIKRLWIQSMEERAIADGMAVLRNGADYDSLYRSALCRSKADWLVGINASRLFSVLYDTTLNVGRVQTPTLAMIVERESAINSFTKEPFYTVELDCKGFAAKSERFKEKPAAETVRADCDGKDAVIAAVEKQKTTTAPPRLYDLTALQRDANKRLGYTAQQTLEYMQSLYEKKMATYPRTDSRFLTGDMEARIPALVEIARSQCPELNGLPEMTLIASQVVDNSKVSDHHAIIPTAAVRDTDLSSLPAGERDLLRLVCVRLICAVADKHVYSETTVTVECAGNHFSAKGKTVLSNGWKAADSAYRANLKNKDTDESDDDGKETPLPALTEGQVIRKVAAALHEGFTTPPKRFTEASLLSAMESAGEEDMPEDTERKGLGTPATRAGIIERLIATAMIERRRKLLVPTCKGKNLIAVVPEDIKSAKLTADWEHRLGEIERGELGDGAFLDDIAAMTRQIVSANTAPPSEFRGLFATPGKAGTKGAIVGKCPRCGSPVHEGDKGFFCENCACGFKLWRDNIFFKSKKKVFTKDIAAALLKEGRVFLSGLYSEKTGRKYDATVVMDDTGGKYVNFKLEFRSKGEKHERKVQAQTKARP